MPETPAILPPAGHVAFGHDDTLLKWDIVCVTVCLSAATIAFSARTYARGFVKREWIWEDYMTCISYSGLVIYCSVMTTVMKRHGGVHEWDLTKAEVQVAIYWFNIASIIYGIEMLFTKLTVLSLYRRVFVPQRWTKFDILLRSFEFTLIGFYFGLTVCKIWECNPRARIWNKSLAGTCVDIPKLLNASGLFNLLTDILILLIPIKAVWNLKMKRQRKIQVVLIFTFGLIAPVFSLVGFLVREKISDSPDTTFNQPLILLWGCAEVSTAFLCVCLPPLTILFRKRERGPTQSIIRGDSNNPSKQKSANSKRKTGKFGLSSIGDSLGTQNDAYLELEEGSNFALSDNKGDSNYRVGVTATHSSDNSREALHGPEEIMKTVKISQSYK